ncbi:lipid-binding SYLF domain-containing protein [Galbibacter sp. BG1]|uniref:lipid-binding SYLF domain-containing protein n=1 Tax=Galbibacter sp. BG1 TaxID=1170699 RepID=UPI0015C0A643|nr:lipid-binding SYLF domain-containing protein [Galbibacter sp. BG1]QLE02834.1 lipid-binding SYLF domain-containing protein [Galbibacter sp. BG1]
MKKLKLFTTIVFTAITLFAFSQTEKDQKIMSDAENAKQLLQKSDKGLEKFFESASGYVIFPNVGEGAFIVGGASGNGVLYENGAPVGMASLKKVDIGLQAGGQEIVEIIFFETEEALNEFKQEEIKFSAEASAIAVKEGAAKNANYNDGMIIFTKPKKGLMADLSIGGQKFKYTPFDNK